MPELPAIPAGWPSPSDDYIEGELDLQQLVVKNPPWTYFLRAMGHSMQGAGIYDGDILVVDRSLDAANNRIVIAAIDGELTIKRLHYRGKRIFLAPENPEYEEIEITGNPEAYIWGVVTYNLHKLT